MVRLTIPPQHALVRHEARNLGRTAFALGVRGVISDRSHVLLLDLVGNEDCLGAISHLGEPERDGASGKTALGHLGALTFDDTFPNPFPLQLRECRHDREYHVRYRRLGYRLGTEITKDETDLLLLEALDHHARIGRGSEHAVELGGDYGVARLDSSQQLFTGRTLGKRDRARNAGIDVGQEVILADRATQRSDRLALGELLLDRGLVGTSLLDRRCAGVSVNQNSLHSLGWSGGPSLIPTTVHFDRRALRLATSQL